MRGELHLVFAFETRASLKVTNQFIGKEGEFLSLKLIKDLVVYLIDDKRTTRHTCKVSSFNTFYKFETGGSLSWKCHNFVLCLLNKLC